MKRLSGGEVGRSRHSSELRRKKFIYRAQSAILIHFHLHKFGRACGCCERRHYLPKGLGSTKEYLSHFLPRCFPRKDFFFIEIDITKCFFIRACSCYFHQSMIHPRHHHILLRKIEVILRGLIVYFQWIFYVQIPNTYLRSLFLLSIQTV